MKKINLEISDNESGGEPEEHTQTSSSRRDFLRRSAAGVGAAVAAGTAAQGFAAESTDIANVKLPSITIPTDFTESLAQDAKPGKFEGRGMSGAEVFANLCKAEDLSALFCCPGNYTVINALAAAGIPSYGGRSEGAMCAMADGFSRATGEVTATSGTEGPGFTNMIMNIAAASAARTPLLVLASNMQMAGDDREAFIQTGYQQPTTEGIKKYGKRLIDPSRVHEYGGYAFRQLKSGVPGPVHLDFPAEVARAKFKDPSELKDFYDKSKYRTESRCYPAPSDIKQVVNLISKSKRPLIVAGQGVFQRKGWDALKRVAERNQIAVATSGPTRGTFPDEHPLCVMAAPDALLSADLVIFVGQYCMPSPGEYRFNPEIKAIRVHPVQEDLGRNWPLDLGVVSDETLFLEALADAVGRKKRGDWVSEIGKAKQAYETQIEDVYQLGLKYSKQTNMLHPAVIARDAQHFIDNDIEDRLAVVTGAGGWTTGLFAGRYLRANRPGHMIVPPYQYGAIGPDMSMMMGVSAAVQRGVGPQAGYEGAPTLCITSDAGVAYSMFELDTAAKYKLPTITVIYNNNAWGVWPNAARSARSMHMYLFQENLRYDLMAKGLGANGEYVRTPEEFRAALARAYKLARDEKVSSLINCQAIKEFTSPRDYPPGIALNAEPGTGAVAH
ncbi:thiamine pyrophosphate-binding protein [Pseudohalioglobus lutimaris]|uniref:thiamine pyrophosphate-binding protein n=1 Tax=Pseudohalioglobus lutimaris TaxID=1737061 RepID=UPI0013FE24FE|nr:thiamine pyrophosphate-binding protein [Pseudohalioglobus lutimaris]